MILTDDEAIGPRADSRGIVVYGNDSPQSVTSFRITNSKSLVAGERSEM